MSTYAILSNQASCIPEHAAQCHLFNTFYYNEMQVTLELELLVVGLLIFEKHI